MDKNKLNLFISSLICRIAVECTFGSFVNTIHFIFSNLSGCLKLGSA